MLKSCDGGFGSHVTTLDPEFTWLAKDIIYMHSNTRVWRRKLFSMVLMGWPANTSKGLSLSYKCSRLFAFLWVCLFTSSPLSTCPECCPAAGRARRGLTSKPQSWSQQPQVPSPVIWKCWGGWKGFSELWNTLGCRLCSVHSGGRQMSSGACLGLNSQQNTYLLCHALLVTPLSTASLTWCLKQSYNAHLSLLGEKNSVNAAFE